MERQREELEDVREALGILRARQAVEPLNDPQQRLYDKLSELERDLARAVGLQAVSA